MPASQAQTRIGAEEYRDRDLRRRVGRGTRSARMRAVPTWVWIARGEVPGSEVGIKVCSDQSCVLWVSGSLICFLCKDGRLPVSLGVISPNLVAYIDTRGLVLLYRAAIQRFSSALPFHNFFFLVTCDFGVKQKMPFAGVNSIYLLSFSSDFCGSLFYLWKKRGLSVCCHAPIQMRPHVLSNNPPASALVVVPWGQWAGT